jgi:long-chain acyl-CoA synthetase
MNTADYLLKNGIHQDIALVCENARYTFGDINIACKRMAAELLRLGVRPLDRVGILDNNSLFWVASYLAILRSGAVAVPFSTTLTVEEFQRNRHFTDCKVICISSKQFQKYSTAFSPGLELIFDKISEQNGPLAWPDSPLDFNPDQDAALMLTSGTTAAPRAVRITHRNIQANTDSIIEYLELDNRERMLDILPFYYCFGTSLLHTHLRVGASLVLCNSFVYPEPVLDILESNACTGFAGVPSTYQLLLRNSTFPKRKRKPLRKIQQAGGKLHNVLINELVACQPQARIYVMYGQTEATARLSYLPPAMLPEKLGSMGKGIPHVDLRVLNENEEPVKPGQVGEIYATGENISPGYWKDPAASAEKFVDGVLKTGDLATVDNEGYIYIVDRKADFIKSLGYRVSSQEVESCILELEDVVSAAVIGELDMVRGEAIRAFVVFRTGTSLTTEEIMNHCRKRMARHMIPRDITIVPNLPLNAHGKVVKAELRKQLS